MLREDLKKFALKHNWLIKSYRATLGKLKTKYFFDFQKKALQNKGYSIIEKIDNELSAKNVQYFVDCGTLLGLIRDKKLIEYDRDIDFGIYFSKEFTPKDLDRVMRKLKMKKVHTFYYKNRPVEFSYSDGVTHVDFFRHIETKSNSLIYVFYRKMDVEYPDDKTYTVLEMHRTRIPGLVRFNSGTVQTNVPANSEEYLASAYSANWRIPDPTWRYTSEPGLVEIQNEYGIKK